MSPLHVRSNTQQKSCIEFFFVCCGFRLRGWQAAPQLSPLKEYARRVQISNFTYPWAFSSCKHYGVTAASLFG